MTAADTGGEVVKPRLPNAKRKRTLAPAGPPKVSLAWVRNLTPESTRVVEKLDRNHNQRPISGEALGAALAGLAREEAALLAMVENAPERPGERGTSHSVADQWTINAARKRVRQATLLLARTALRACLAEGGDRALAEGLFTSMADELASARLGTGRGWEVLRPVDHTGSPVESWDLERRAIVLAGIERGLSAERLAAVGKRHGLTSRQVGDLRRSHRRGWKDGPRNEALRDAIAHYAKEADLLTAEPRFLAFITEGKNRRRAPRKKGAPPH